MKKIFATMIIMVFAAAAAMAGGQKEAPKPPPTTTGSAQPGAGIDIVRNGGTIIMIGLASPTFEIEYKHAVAKELTLQGSYMYTSEMREGLQLIADGKVNVKQIITSELPMSEGPRIFEELVSGKSSEIKVILTNS